MLLGQADGAVNRFLNLIILDCANTAGWIQPFFSKSNLICRQFYSAFQRKLSETP